LEGALRFLKKKRLYLILGQVEAKIIAIPKVWVVLAILTEMTKLIRT
jgi:hypothetical protein